ncbi:MAG TPA: hypothetical protein VFP37_16000 [Steroidobacteraceae bacterium]|nr:hypothetical protein [Steroidobacteraceae bacterium]
MSDGGRQPEATPQASDIDEAAHPAREMSLHLLRMLETRMEAAGLVLQAEGQRLIGRLQLQVLAGAAGFIALWGGIVLLAIALPPHLRVPVLAAVIAAFVLLAAWALLRARRMIAGREVGSVAWLLDSMKLDLEVLARALAPPPAAAQPPPAEPPRSSGDLAA